MIKLVERALIDVMQIPDRARARIVSAQERGGDRKRLSGGKYRDKMNEPVISFRCVKSEILKGWNTVVFFLKTLSVIFLCSKFFVTYSLLFLYFVSRGFREKLFYRSVEKIHISTPEIWRNNLSASL